MLKGFESESGCLTQNIRKKASETSISELCPPIHVSSLPCNVLDLSSLKPRGGGAGEGLKRNSAHQPWYLSNAPAYILKQVPRALCHNPHRLVICQYGACYSESSESASKPGPRGKANSASIFLKEISRHSCYAFARLTLFCGVCVNTMNTCWGKSGGEILRIGLRTFEAGFWQDAARASRWSGVAELIYKVAVSH